MILPLHSIGLSKIPVKGVDVKNYFRFWFYDFKFIANLRSIIKGFKVKHPSLVIRAASFCGNGYFVKQVFLTLPGNA